MQLLHYRPLMLFTRPIAALLLALALLTVAWNLYQALRTPRSREA